VRRAEQPPAERQTWLIGLRAGDITAFEQIYKAFFLALWEFAVRRVPTDVAEDIVQDVLFALWRRREDLHIDDHLGPYLFAAVRSKVIQHLRHERVVEAAERERSDAPFGIGEAPPTPDDDAEFEELQAAVRQALSHLSEQQQTILTLRWTQGMTYDEIATVLGISREAAKKAGARAQKIVLPLLAPFDEPA
jgi:RNA polymerase sigma-70 factor (ECF subfamily)